MVNQADSNVGECPLSAKRHGVARSLPVQCSPCIMFRSKLHGPEQQFGADKPVRSASMTKTRDIFQMEWANFSSVGHIFDCYDPSTADVKAIAYTVLGNRQTGNVSTDNEDSMTSLTA